MERRKKKNGSIGKGVLTVGVITGFAGALMIYSHEPKEGTDEKPLYEHVQIQRIGFKPVQPIEHWNDLKDVALRCPTIRAITEANSCQSGCYLYQGVRIEMMGSDTECFGLWKGTGELTLKHSGEKITFSKAKVMVSPSDTSVTLFDSIGETKLQIHEEKVAGWEEIFTLSPEMAEFISSQGDSQTIGGRYRHIIYTDGEAIAFESGLSFYRFKKPFVGLETLVERITLGTDSRWERTKTNQHEKTSYTWGDMQFEHKKTPGKESILTVKFNSDLREELIEQSNIEYSVSLGFKEKTNEELTRSLGYFDGKYLYLKEKNIYIDGVLSQTTQVELNINSPMNDTNDQKTKIIKETVKHFDAGQLTSESIRESSTSGDLLTKRYKNGVLTNERIVSSGQGVQESVLDEFGAVTEHAEQLSDGAGGSIEQLYKNGVLYTKTKIGQHGDQLIETYDPTGAMTQTSYEDSKGNKEITKILPDKKIISQFKRLNGNYQLIDTIEETEKDGYVIMKKVGETSTIALWRSKENNKVFRSVITAIDEGQYRNIIMPVENQTFGNNKATGPSIEVLGRLEFVNKYHTAYQFPVTSTGRLARVIEGNNEIFWEYEKDRGESETVTTTMNMDVIRADESILKGGKIKRIIKVSNKEVAIIGDETFVRSKSLSDFPAAKDGDSIWIKNRGHYVEYDYERSNGEHLIVMHDKQTMKPTHASHLMKTEDNQYMRVFSEAYGNMRLKGSREDLLSLEQPVLIKDRALDEPVHLMSKGDRFEYRYKNTHGKEVTFEVRDAEISKRSRLREWL